MLPKIDVVILNYNTVSLLNELLPKVINQCNYENVRLVVADNASTDGSAEMVAEKFPNLHLIELEENTGYAGGYNKALEQLDADYYLLLNSDAELSNNWLEPLLEIIESNSKIGAIQPHILDYNKRDQFEYAGAGGGFIDAFGFPFCRGRIFGTVEKNTQQYNHPMPVFWASGAAFFISKKAFNDAGGFDESFFAHMEEIDLCWRLQNLGYQIWSCPKSVVYHIGGGTLNNQSPRKTYLNFRNGLLLLYKNLTKEEREQVIFKRKLWDGLAAVFYLLQGKVHHIPAIYKAHRDFEKMKINYRTEHEFHKPMKELKGMFNGSLVVQYFLKGGKYFHALRKEYFN